MVEEPLNLSVQITKPLWCHFVICFLSSGWYLLLCLYFPQCASANCLGVICRRPRPLSFSQLQMCQINSQSSRAYRRSHYCHCRNVPSVPISALLIYIRLKYYSSVWRLFLSLPLMVLADPQENVMLRGGSFMAQETREYWVFHLLIGFFWPKWVWRNKNRDGWDSC